MAKIKVKPVRLTPQLAHHVYVNVVRLGGLEKSTERQSRGRIINVMEANKAYHKQEGACKACSQPLISFGYELGKTLVFLFTLPDRKLIFRRLVEDIMENDPNPMLRENLKGISEALGKRWARDYEALTKEDEPDMEAEEEIVEADEDDELELEEEIEDADQPPTPAEA
jgi:hypothetical protein